MTGFYQSFDSFCTNLGYVEVGSGPVNEANSIA